MYNIYKYPILMIGGADLSLPQLSRYHEAPPLPEEMELQRLPSSRPPLNEAQQQIEAEMTAMSLRELQEFATEIARPDDIEAARDNEDPAAALRELVLSWLVTTNEQKDANQRAIENDWMELVQIDGNNLRNAPEIIRNNREIVLAAVQQNGLALQNASNYLKNDREIALAAVRQNGKAILYVGKVNDYLFLKEITLAAVRQNGMALELVGDLSLLLDREIVSAAVKQNGLALQYILPSRLIHWFTPLPPGKPDAAAAASAYSQVVSLNIAIAAVKNNKDAMQYLSEEMREKVSRYMSL